MKAPDPSEEAAVIYERLLPPFSLLWVLTDVVAFHLQFYNGARVPPATLESDWMGLFFFSFLFFFEGEKGGGEGNLRFCMPDIF